MHLQPATEYQWGMLPHKRRVWARVLESFKFHSEILTEVWFWPVSLASTPESLV